MDTYKHKPKGVKVPPFSTKDIRQNALRFRRDFFKFRDDEAIDFNIVQKVLEKNGVTIAVKTKEAMGEFEALTNPNKLEIFIREDVYENLYQDDGRARFTVAHEIGHLIMHDQVSLARTNNADHKAYEDSEWQADTFAAEFLMPFNQCQIMVPQAIQDKFMVSAQAAIRRVGNLNK